MIFRKNYINQIIHHLIINLLISNTEDWVISLQQIGQQNANYSFYEQLDNQIKISEFDSKPIISQINTMMNLSWNQKIIKKLNEFTSFEYAEQLLSNLLSMNQQSELIKQNNINQEQQQIKNDFDLKFKLIDDITKQTCYGYSIVFNNTGSIMISNDFNTIKVWNFTQGKLQLKNTFHQINGLFISGFWDKQIICWKQISYNEWKWSQLYEQHTNWVSCLILNKQEDQLISGCTDKSIKIWNVDFVKNELTYLYSLDNTYIVYSLSLNQSETMFASCARYSYLIWQKGIKDKWELHCKQQVTEGHKIYFMNDQQFIWVTKDKILIKF